MRLASSAHPTVLILSDLGCNDPGDHRRRRWLRFGDRLNKAGCRPVALMPAPPRCWDAALARLFPPACWDRVARLPRRIERTPPRVRRESPEAAERLLGLLSPAIRVEPALLRAARCLLPARQADVGTEAAVWNHPEVHRTLTAFYHDPGAAVRYRERFRAEPDPALRSALARLIREHHAPLSPAIGLEESRILAELSGEPPTAGEEVEAILRFQRRLAKTCAGLPGGLGDAVRHWIVRVGGRRPPPGFWECNPALEAAWLLACRHHPDPGEAVEPPPGLSPLRASWALAGRREAEIRELRQRGETLYFEPAANGLSLESSNAGTRQSRLLTGGTPVLPSFHGSPLPEGEGTGETSGSPIAVVEAVAAYLSIVTADAPQRLRALDEPIRLAELPERFLLVTDREEWAFDRIGRPEWAEAIGRDGHGLWVETLVATDRVRLYWQPQKEGGESGWRGGAFGVFRALGRDDYGLYADLAIENLTQRFRWIPPGRFLMGSPESESERFDDETRHPVTLTQGFWLANTACTQALWQAVMGDNPSQFKDDPANPVENVSWNDVQGFLDQLNERVPGLAARLPTEAEWEYACRAGTPTPFSFGENIGPEQVNYDGNYPYRSAPLTASSGGEKGLFRGKTVPVTSLPANPWGLYEMHGNVWEWCADWYGPYPTSEISDPQGLPEGADRVLRGGSWISTAAGARVPPPAARTIPASAATTSVSAWPWVWAHPGRRRRARTPVGWKPSPTYRSDNLTGILARCMITYIATQGDRAMWEAAALVPSRLWARGKKYLPA